jgi:hypothetical protein
MAELMISQAKNYRQEFGEIFRSSGIFYYRYAADFSTTISFLDYWKIKRQLDVGVIASVRSIDGTLLKREHLEFVNGRVINYEPRFSDKTSFEGSVEIEVFSSKNLVIPFAAIMALYKAKDSYCAAHTYTRTYYPHEIEAGEAITIGEEACWTVNDTDQWCSIGIFHNGSEIQPSQIVKLEVRRLSGEKIAKEFPLPELQPYATVVVRPRNHIPHLCKFLDGEIGHAAISFRLKNSFTRMLVGNETIDGSQFHVGHSNFNYSRHKTDHVELEGARSYFYAPALPGYAKEFLVFPDSDRGIYEMEAGNTTSTFTHSQSVLIPLVTNQPQLISFRKRDGALPSRIIVAIRAKSSSWIPAECTLGAMHRLRPPKRFWWNVATARSIAKTKIILFPIEWIYGPFPQNDKFTLSLYSSSSLTNKDVQFAKDDLKNFATGVYLNDIFPDADEFLDGQPGYYTLFSGYGGVFVYSLFEPSNGSVALEHGF